MLHNYLREVKQKKFWRRISQSEIRKIAAAKKEAPSEAANRLWWCLLDDVRTFFEQNPDAD